MHESVMDYVKAMSHYYEFQRDKYVLDVGSYNVNGTPRDLFYECNWCGIDLEPGPYVDHVCDAHDLVEKFGEDRFDVGLCLEMLEHDTEPWTTVKNIATVVHRGGFVILTARGFDKNGCFAWHEHPVDCYRFSDDAFYHLAEWAGMQVLDARPDPHHYGSFLTAKVI